MLLDIEKRLNHPDPAIRIYKERCVLNAAACSLLGISRTGDKVFVRQDDNEARNGRCRMYVARSDKHVGYPVNMRGKCGRINSVTLCRKLSSLLQGYGAYRVCEEVTLQADSVTWYEIFFRRYA